MRSPSLPWAVLWAASASAMPVQIAGQPGTVSLTETADVSYHRDNGNIAPVGNPDYDPTSNNYADWLNRLDGQLSWGNWHAELRFDSALFFNAPSVTVPPGTADTCIVRPADPSCENLHLAGLLQNRYNPNFQLEKVAVDYTGDHLLATLGDFYLSYGRGLVISLLKVDALGVDTTLRGINLTGRSGGFSANVAAGVTNTVNTDEATGEVAPDPMDRVVAGRLEYRWPKLFTLGVDGAGFFDNPDVAALSSWRPGDPTVSVPISYLGFGSVTSQPPLPAKGLRDTGNFSATLDLPHLGEIAKAYVEVALQRHWVGADPLSNPPASGSAVFASVALFLGKATVTVEGKDYRNFFFPIPTSLPTTMFSAFSQQNVYTNPPNLEEQFQEETSTQSIYGPRLTVDYDVTDWLRPFASFAFFEDDTNQYDIYAGSLGVEAFWQDRRSHAKLASGVRDVVYNGHSSSPGATYQLEWWAQFDVVQVINATYSLQLEGLHRRYAQDPVLTGHGWSWGYAYLSLRRHEWSATAGYEYNTQHPDQWRPDNPNVGFAWTPNDHYTVRLFAGAREAGLRCINGMCRVYPGFTGGSAELVVRY